MISDYLSRAVPRSRSGDDSERLSIGAGSLALLDEANPLVQVHDNRSVSFATTLTEQPSDSNVIIEIQAGNGTMNGWHSAA
jgi:hypothetical protein